MDRVSGVDRESYGNTVSAPSRITMRRDEVDEGGSFLPLPVRKSHDYGANNQQPGKKLLGGGRGGNGR